MNKLLRYIMVLYILISSSSYADNPKDICATKPNTCKPADMLDIQKLTNLGVDQINVCYLWPEACNPISNIKNISKFPSSPTVGIDQFNICFLIPEVCLPAPPLVQVPEQQIPIPNNSGNDQINYCFWFPEICSPQHPQ